MAPINKIITVSLFLAAANAFSEHIKLSDAEKMAAKKSFAILASQKDRQIGAWEKRKTIGGYLPNIAFSSSYSHTEADAEAFGMDGFPQTGMSGTGFLPFMENSFSHQVRIDQPLSNGGAEIFAVRIANLSTQLLELHQEDARQAAILNVRRAYLNAVAAAEIITVEELALSWADKNLSEAITRSTIGTLPETDILRWEAEVLDRKARLKKAEADYVSSVLGLLYEAGYGPGQIGPDTVTLENIERLETLYERSPVDTVGPVQNSPGYKIAAKLTEIADERKNLAIAGFIPRLNAFYSLAWPQDSVLIPSGERYWTAGLRLDIPLFAGFTTSSSYKIAGIEAEKSALDLARAARQISSLTGSNRAQYEASYDNVAAARKRKQVIEKTLSMMQKRYDGGMISQTELLEISIQVDQARAGYIQSLVMCLIHEAQYLKSIGKLEVTQ
ncbi:MAG: hypothetical protein GF350_06160 [Chitinivibrionales bacterium]|nr:hypothetical protein [Chitinivibrionales bacterium]